MIRDAVEAVSRLLAVFRRRSLDHDFNDEFAAHLDLLTARNESRGLPHDEARRQAILQMGGLAATKDLHRDGRGLPRLDRLLETARGAARDLVHAARALAKAPGFTFVCVASLSLGMAAVIAIPHAAKLLFMPPVGVNADGLTELLIRPQGPLRIQLGDARTGWSYADYADLRDASPPIDLTGWALGESVVTLSGAARSTHETLPTIFVSPNYFRAVGVSLARGPGFESTRSAVADPVVVLGYGFWQHRLESTPDVVGRTLTVNGTPYTIVGVAPEGYCAHLNNDICAGAEPDGMALFMPLERHPRLLADARLDRSSSIVRLHGRLHRGVTIEQANAAVSGVMSALAQRYPATNQHKAASVEPYFAVGAAVRPRFLLYRAAFLGVTGIVLLVVCLNISGMVQARSAIRERDLSVRQAIGASRGRLLWTLLCEALILAGLGGAFATLVLFGVPQAAFWWLGQSLSPDAFAHFQQMLRPTLPIVLLAVGLCVAASLAFGLLPALRFSRPTLISAMKDDAGGGGRRVGRVQRFASALQVGIAVPFLVVSGTMIDWVRTAASGELGFRPEGLAAVRLDLGTDDKTRGFQLRNALDVLARTSGVESVSVADALPFEHDFGISSASRAGQADVVAVLVTRVGERYLETVDIPLVRGRAIGVDDTSGAEPVAVVSKPVADRLFAAGDPIGQLVTLTIDGSPSRAFRIVGVTADFIGRSFDSPRTQVLVPLAQHPTSRVLLVARAAEGLASSALTPAFQEAVRDLDPEFTPASVITGERLRQRGIDDLFVPAVMVGAGGGAVLILAALGIYGIIGFMVATRRREIAVRVALGASRARVLTTIQADVVRLVVPGVLIGLLIAIVMARMIVPWRGLTAAAMEPLIHVLGASVAVTVALIASLLPARRAASIDPMAAMRSE